MARTEIRIPLGDGKIAHLTKDSDQNLALAFLRKGGRFLSKDHLDHVLDRRTIQLESPPEVQPAG